VTVEQSLRPTAGLIALIACLLFSESEAMAAERLHLLIPAGPGGGLDSTARAIGEALRIEEVRSPVSYENMTGGGGGRAMAHFIETADRQQETLLINSTPLIIRSLQGLFPHDHHDLVPIAGLVGEYGAFVVRADSKLSSWLQFIDLLKDNPRGVNVGGGSVRGSLDHLILALALEKAGIEPRTVRYLPYDAGGKAMLALLGGEVEVLSTGIGEAISYAQSGDVRVLGVTGPQRLPQLPDSPTLTELGTPLVFANWRGVFAAPGTTPDQARLLQQQVQQGLVSAAWLSALERYGWTPLELMGDKFTRYLDEQASILEDTLLGLGFIRR
jgi:putative tricarboxylic transport membrane protein